MHRQKNRFRQISALLALALLALLMGAVWANTVLATVASGPYAAVPPGAVPAGQPAQSQNQQAPASQVSATYRGVSTAVHFDVSPPLRSMRPTKGLPGPEREIPEGGPNGTVMHPTGQSPALQAFDPVRQSKLGPFAIPTPLVTFDGLNNISGYTPPDPVGAIGPNHYVMMSNVSFGIYNRTGTLVFGPALNNTLWAGFGGPCQTQNAGDPIVVYDHLADRWLLTQFTSTGPTYYNCLALSTTSDPTGTYYRWAFSTGPNFPDYPKYGLWPDAYYISTREFAPNGSFAGVGAYAGNRAQMLAGNPTPQLISFLAGPAPAYNVGDGLLPAYLDGATLPPANSPNYWTGTMDNNATYGAPQDAITLWKFHADFATPPNSSFTLANTIPTAPFDSIFPCTPTSRNCIPQPSTTNKVDILSYRQRPIWRLAYRNFGTHESLVTNQSVEASTNMAGNRWYELRSPNSSPTIFQQGTFSPGETDGIHRWMASIAMDRDGNMGLAYSASSSTLFPSLRYTGRLVTDPPGQMPQGEASFIEGTGSQTGSPRWGDYSSLNMDPVDDCTFWFVSQYIPTTSSVGWRMRVGAFKFPTCGQVQPTATPTTPPVTNTPIATNTPIPTDTPVPPTATSTVTPTPCVITFSDVHPEDYYYKPVTYLYCRGVISGYGDGTFKPGNNTTRGQLAKIVVLAEGWQIYTPPAPTFQDVPANDTFYGVIETAYNHGIISGYNCGAGCLEYRPGNNVTRGQLSKIVVLAEEWAPYTPPTPTFVDVPPTDPFYTNIETAYNHGIISGYSCGTDCLEFRPGNNATRGQISKIVYLAVTGP